MHIDSKAISWLILAVGLFLYLWNITENEFVHATIFMASSILLWMFVGFINDSFSNNDFALVLSGSGFLLAISVFFIYGLEEIPYPSGAIVFHSDGIAKALGLGIASALPLLFGMSNFEKHHNGSQSQKPNVSAQPTKILEDEEYELADIDDLTSGDFEI